MPATFAASLKAWDFQQKRELANIGKNPPPVTHSGVFQVSGTCSIDHAVAGQLHDAKWGLYMKFSAYLLAAAAALSLASCTTTPADPNERPATKAEIENRAIGHTLNGKLTYNTDGTYRYNGGNPGRYTITEGKICIAFNDGGSRCDRITTNGKAYYLINSGGQRYPFGS